MRRIRAALNSDVDGTPRHSPLVVPRPVDGLVCKRVLVMDYLDGEPLSRAVEQARILSGMGRLGTRLGAARAVGAYLGQISRASRPHLAQMRLRGIDPEGAEAKLFGTRLLSTLTDAFGRTILSDGCEHSKSTTSTTLSDDASSPAATSQPHLGHNSAIPRLHLGRFFHADPHPGNIFILADGRIGLIDFGQVHAEIRRDRME